MGLRVVFAVAVVGFSLAGCTPAPTPTPGPGAPARFAVAYTNLDGVDGYNNDVDVLIAELVDTNGDGVVSVGDTVRTDMYPVDETGTLFGAFTVRSHAVTSVGVVAGDEVTVGATRPPPNEQFSSGFTFAHELVPAGGSQYTRERYYETDGLLNFANFRDTWADNDSTLGNNDRIQATQGASPSQGTVTDFVYIGPFGDLNDDTFVDVDITL